MPLEPGTNVSYEPLKARVGRLLVSTALFYKWSSDGALEGVMLTHVDDILVTGGPSAIASFEEIGKELGFGSIEKNQFTFCGKSKPCKP